MDEDLSKCRCDKERMQVTHPDIANNKFTPGELNVLNVFRFRTCLDTYFDEAGNANPQKWNSLKGNRLRNLGHLFILGLGVLSEYAEPKQYGDCFCKCNKEQCDATAAYDKY